MNAFVENENLEYVLKKLPANVQYTFTGISNNHSLIDHFIVSQNLSNHVVHYFTEDSIDNLSDHLPLYLTLCCNHDDNICSRNTNNSNTSRKQWSSASDEQIKLYQLELNNRLACFSLPQHIVYCNDVSTCAHAHDITRFHDEIVTSLIVAMNKHIYVKQVVDQLKISLVGILK